MRPVLVFAVIAFSLGGLAFWRSMAARPAAERRAGWVKYGTYLGIVLVAILAWAAGTWALAALVAAIVLRGFREIALLGPGAGRVPAWSLPVYGAGSLLALAGALLVSPDVLMFVFVVVATFDGAAQVAGQLFGRHALAARVSPNKTVEGALGGLFAAVVAAWAARGLAPVDGSAALLLALPVAAIGLGGDLSASWVKRRAGVKDFHPILPGHGGVLDRFDGLLPNYALLGLVALLSEAAR